MALIASDKPGITRLTQLEVIVRGAHGGGNEPSIGAGGVVPVNIKIPATSKQTVPAFQVQRVASGVVTTLFDIDQNGNIGALGGISSLTMQQAQVALTAANINGMYAAPVVIVAAPGAGLAIVVQEIIFEITTTATQFAAGGVVGFQYDSTINGAGTLVHAGTIPAATITATAGTTVTGLWAASGSNGLVIPANKGIYISNQTQAFTTGTGTAKVWISYGILTL